MSTPQGWYPDPVAPERERWWDGTDWTNDLRSPDSLVDAPVDPALPPPLPPSVAPPAPTAHKPRMWVALTTVMSCIALAAIGVAVWAVLVREPTPLPASDPAGDDEVQAQLDDAPAVSRSRSETPTAGEASPQAPPAEVDAPSTRAEPAERIDAIDAASLEAVHAEIRSRGWEPIPGADVGFPSKTLRAVMAHIPGSATGRPRFIFFAVAGQGVIGTDTAKASSSPNIAWADDTTVAVEYSLYDPPDAMCCPSGSAVVRYRWDGTRLSPLDPIPTNDWDAYGSRR